MSLLFAGGEKPTFETTAGWCVGHLRGFAWKECRELTPRERNIDFADGVAMVSLWIHNPWSCNNAYTTCAGFPLLQLT